MGVSIAMVPLGPDPRVSAAKIGRDLRATWPDLAPVANVEERDGMTSFRIGEDDVVLGHMPAPIPWSDLEGPCATSWIWREAAAVLREHRTHLIVTVSSKAGPVDRARLLTQVTAAVVATCKAALGVTWGEAALVVSAPMFRDFAVEVLPEGPPLPIWVDFRVGRNEGGRTSGFTQGMAGLGLMEIETESSPEPPGELRQRMLGLASYLVEKGPVIADGDTVGEDENERIRVLHAKSAFGGKGRVLRLEYEAVSPARPRKKRPPA